MAQQGCGPVQAVMSDNAKCYATSHPFKEALRDLGARHILIPPRTPRWNGKIERLLRHPGPRMGARTRLALLAPTRPRPSSFMRYYNRRRPHSARGSRAHITRVHQLRGQGG
jgi:transposase InsO family protein